MWIPNHNLQIANNQDTGFLSHQKIDNLWRIIPGLSNDRSAGQILFSFKEASNFELVNSMECGIEIVEKYEKCKESNLPTIW